MAYASRAGRARVSAKKPQAFAVCQRCGIWHNRVELNFQFDWRGSALQNLYILVCRRCLDTPQEQLRAITLPADPTPIFYPSVENFADDESDYRSISEPTVLDPVTGIPIPGTTLRVTEDCQNRTVDPFGLPVGFNQNAVMPQFLLQKYGVPLNVLSVISNGSATVQVTCSSVHNLQSVGPNSEVSIQGLADNNADGFYSVTVLTATVFTYMTYGAIAANSLLTPTSLIITAFVGLPYGYDQIPKIIGPPLFAQPVAVCFLETEDGTGLFLLEDGSGFIQLETCNQIPTADFLFELESGLGTILLESGNGSLELEAGP
jgi:hypothetical protein